MLGKLWTAQLKLTCMCKNLIPSLKKKKTAECIWAALDSSSISCMNIFFLFWRRQGELNFNAGVPGSV